MGFRYRKTRSVDPEVKVDANKESASVRFDGKGAGVTQNTNGKSGASNRRGCLISVIAAVLVLSIGIAILFRGCQDEMRKK